MDNNKAAQNSKKANRLLYIVIVAVLCVTALVIGLTAALSQRTEEPPPVDDGTVPDDGEEEKPAPDDGNETPSGGEPTPDETPVTLASPLAGVVSKNHSADTLVYSLTMNDYRTHAGIDIATTVGSGVYACAAGTVKRVWDDPMMGKCVSIDHGKGIETVYKNLAEELADGIEENATVKSAQLIGAVGDSAIMELAEEPHLHFEVLVDGEGVDPVSLLSDDSIETGLSGSDVYED